MLMCYSVVIVLLIVSFGNCIHEMTRTLIYGVKTEGQMKSGVSIMNILTSVQCGRYCSRHPLCRRFSYRADSRECRVYNATHGLDDTGAATYGRVCPTDLGYISYSRTRCLKKSSAGRTYVDAKADCMSENAHLFALEGESDMALTYLMEVMPVWIDGMNMSTWYDASLPWEKWGSLSPKIGQCTYAFPFEGLMYTGNCGVPQLYICQVDV